jgi:hypothetical protein
MSATGGRASCIQIPFGSETLESRRSVGKDVEFGGRKKWVSLDRSGASPNTASRAPSTVGESKSGGAGSVGVTASSLSNCNALGRRKNLSLQLPFPQERQCRDGADKPQARGATAPATTGAAAG